MFHLLWHNITLSQPAPHLNAKMNLLLLHTISQVTMELADGNTKEILLMLKRSMSQDVTLMKLQLVNARIKFQLLHHQQINIQKTTRLQISELITKSRHLSLTWILLRRNLEHGLSQRRMIRRLLPKNQRSQLLPKR